MSEMELCKLVGAALTDSEFRDKLLRRECHALLDEYDLTEEEREAILAIEAESVQGFAAQLCERLEIRGDLLPSSHTHGGDDVIPDRSRDI